LLASSLLIIYAVENIYLLRTYISRERPPNIVLYQLTYKQATWVTGIRYCSLYIGLPIQLRATVQH